MADLPESPKAVFMYGTSGDPPGLRLFMDNNYIEVAVFHDREAATLTCIEPITRTEMLAAIQGEPQRLQSEDGLYLLIGATDSLLVRFESADLDLEGIAPIDWVQENLKSFAD